MGFIPDRGVSDKKEKSDTTSTITKSDRDKKNEQAISKKKKEDKKKVVSYYLEIDLVDKMKKIADSQDMYYSTLVTSALKYWIAKNN